MMKKLCIFLAAIAALCGCLQQQYEITTPLSVASDQINLSSAAGSTKVMVYSNSDWTVELDRPAPWASLSKLSGSGLNDFEFSYSANYGITRSVNIVLKSSNERSLIKVVQDGAISSPAISFSKPEMVTSKFAATLRDSIRTNLNFCLEDIRARAVYYAVDGSVSAIEEIGPESTGWVTSYSVSPDAAVFSVAENKEGTGRQADVVFYITDGTGAETRSTIHLTQSELEPSFTLSSASGQYYANGKTYSIPSVLNNIWSSDNIQIRSGASWVRAASIDSTGLKFTLDRNTDGQSRSTTINVDCVEGDFGVHAEFSLSQLSNMWLSIEELRSLPEGKLVNDDMLEGFIVSDSSSPNLCSSPQSGQYSFDRGENARTAYLEGTDGMYGVRLKFTSAEENHTTQFEKVRINLNGVDLIRETSPLRITLSGLKASSITRIGEPDEAAVPAKARSISQLSESDIYTYVSIRGVEILQKDGSFTNCSDAFSLKDENNPYSGTDNPWWDVAPLLLHDRSGGCINMLTNAAAPWRRYGEDLGALADPARPLVPQGSGNVKGIIVCDNVAPVRFGDLGTYQIRPMKLEDIALDEASFTSTVVEWNWNDFSPAVTPVVGSGTLDVSGIPDVEGKTVSAAKALSSDYNNTYNGREGDGGNGNGGGVNMAGLVKNGAMKFSKMWWNFSQNKGEYFDIKFNMGGASGTNLFVGLVWGHGEGASSQYCGPSHWKALYSIDGGASWSDVPGASLIENRSCICPDNYSVDACPGFTEHIISLPTSCFGKTDVRVRFQVADLTCDSPAAQGDYKNATCIGGGTLSLQTEPDKCSVVIGTLTVRYN
ncbi:MAG: hypothetical protein MJY62_02320 [Bacteroidales bacterium]|nr:hypothetical protein [Bacteroidales bacterium]